MAVLQRHRCVTGQSMVQTLSVTARAPRPQAVPLPLPAAAGGRVADVQPASLPAAAVHGRIAPAGSARGIPPGGPAALPPVRLDDPDPLARACFNALLLSYSCATPPQFERATEALVAMIQCALPVPTSLRQALPELPPYR